MSKLGAIADDLTGATDLATVLSDRGFRTTVVTEAGLESLLHQGVGAPDSDALVVALKSRTAAVEKAVADSRLARQALEAVGCRRFYVKFCSTFDSTPQGNIGPVLDALAEDVGADHVLVVPAYPATGRTVHRGYLFVQDVLLSESAMQDHPLTPMRESNVVKLLEPQTKNSVHLIGHDVVRAGAAAIRCWIASRRPGRTFYIVDAATDEDLKQVAQAAACDPLLAGAAGLAVGLTGPMLLHPDLVREIPTVPGRRAVLAGSASEATRAQVAHARHVIPSRKLDLGWLSRDFSGAIAELLSWAEAEWRQDGDRPVLVYATADLADLQQTAAHRAHAGALIENALAACAASFVHAGVGQLIVAGGETSGAVVAALGVRTLLVGRSIAPGVPWMYTSTVDGVPLNLALKSGNFGTPSLMLDAWNELG